MTEPAPTPEDAAAARAAEQARLRKERREAKIKAGGAARLNKITGLGGGFQRDPEPVPSAPAPTQATAATATPPSSNSNSAPGGTTKHDDPEEVDISQHYYAPQTTARVPPPSSQAPPQQQPDMTEAQLRQLMLGLDPQQQGGFPPPPAGMEDMANDPMMKIMQQMLGGSMPGGPGGPGGANPFAGTGMEGLFAGAQAQQGQQQQQTPEQVAADSAANIWRTVHAVFALGLGLYVALSTTFTGTKEQRDLDSLAASSLSSSRVDDDPFAAGQQQQQHLLEHQRSIEQTRAYFFYVFTSVEAVLLTTRFFLAKRGSQANGGILWTISGLLPPGNLQSGLRHALQYAEMFSTVRGDALACVFVLGVCCWLRS